MTALIASSQSVVVAYHVPVRAVKVAREYERGVIFRLGRLLPNRRARASSS